MTFSATCKTLSRTITAIGAASLISMTSLLSGCAIGDIALSGPAPDPKVTAHASIRGTVIGGQNPVGFSSINLYAVDNTAYGGGPHALTTLLNGASQYYPGGTTGCSATALTATTYAIAAGTATIVASNTMIAGQLIVIADSGSGLSGTYLVTARTPTSFSVATTLANGAGATSGTFTPICYSVPTSDQNGNFTVTGDFACGAYGSSVVYLQAAGGNPGLSTVAATNTSLVLAALLQTNSSTPTALTCSQLSNANTVNINELTTAAMGIAMGQFFTTTYGGSPSSDGFGSGSSTQAQLGLTNAANTALALVSSATGVANTSYALALGSYSVTVAPEALKLQTIADILANCVNGATNNSSCQTLFTAIKLTGSSTPTDTLQAAALFGINPTAGNSATNMSNLFGLVTAIAAPFPAVATEPADWTIGIQYTDTTTTCTTGDTGTCILNDPQEVLIDGSGNVWVMNHNSTTAASVSELSPAGAPLLNVDKVGTTSFNIISPRNMALDTNGNAWIGTSTTAEIFEIVPGGSSAVLAPTSQPYAPIIDGSNNVFFGFASTSATASVEEFTGDTLSAAHQIEYPILCSTTTNAYTKCSSRAPAETNAFLPQYGAIDTNGNLWFSDGANSPTTSVLIMSGYSFTCTVYPCLGTTTGDTVAETYTILAGGTSGLPTFATPYGVAAGPGGAVWFANNLTASNTLAEMTSTTAGANFGSATTLNRPIYPAVDGAGNVWVTNNAGTSVSEFQGTGANTGTALSPAVTGTAPYTVPGYSHAGMLTPWGLSIDPSGNVWVANNTANTSTAGYGLFELVGAAAPTAAPISNALKNGKVGLKP
jgi:streptogramin lyase